MLSGQRRQNWPVLTKRQAAAETSDKTGRKNKAPAVRFSPAGTGGVVFAQAGRPLLNNIQVYWIYTPRIVHDRAQQPSEAGCGTGGRRADVLMPKPVQSA